jgi:hypothetical protein
MGFNLAFKGLIINPVQIANAFNLYRMKVTFAVTQVKV